MRKKLQYAGTVDSDQPFEVNLKYCIWPLLFSDQWFLPRFTLKVKNLGKEVRRGSLEIEIADFGDVKQLSRVSAYKGPFQDVYHHEVNNLLPGKEDKFTFRIESRFLRQGEYIIRVLFNEWIPSDSSIRELSKQLERIDLSEEEKSNTRRVAEEQMRRMGVDPYAIPKGQFKAKQLFDLRFVEKIKIHSLASTATIIGGFLGTVFATCVTVLYATIKILQENWVSIKSLFE